MADLFTFETSISEQETQFDFQNRQFVYIPDQNNGTYSNGQIVFDLAGLSNSGKFIDFSQSHLVIPLVMNVTLTANTNANAENVFAASLKNGYHQLINSLSVEITNNQVVNLTSYSNLDINYKLLTGASLEDERNFLPSIGFSKDTAESITYSGAASSGGIGEINNKIPYAAFGTANGWGSSTYGQNAGRVERMKSTSFDPANTTISQFTNSSYAIESGKNYCTQTATSINYYILATIPLKVLHDIFKKLPLTKGMYIRLIINSNAVCSTSLTVTGSNTYSAISTSSPNGVLPFMVSPIHNAPGTGLSTTACTALNASLAIGKNTLGTSHPSITQCRIYACCYEMSPLYEERYFSLVPTKKVLYNDILTFQLMNQQSGAQISQILTNGLSRVRSLLIVPMISSVINGSANVYDGAFTAGILAGSPMNSPFSSAPGTTAPHAYITSFNVLQSGTALYQSNINYGFEHYLNEVRSSNAINGGVSIGLSAGLLSQSDWENGYRYVFVDLSRKSSQSMDDVSRSLQVVFKNSSRYAIDYYFVVNYEREITISTSTGSLVI